MMKAAMWAVTIGVTSLVVASLAATAVRPGAVVFATLLVASVGIVCTLLTLLVELTPRTGAAGGVVGAVLCGVVFALMVWFAPLAPGATRPGLRWQEALGFAGLVAACAGAGWLGTRRRKKK
ncbi:MAG TPA: hypothetical protein VLW85_05600 [Myxococcales bacterium]|nr:hypothetical protein [Myxococcales bacterium]